MFGAIIGDIAGSRFEWNNHKTKDFPLLARGCRATDDSVMSLAVCNALLGSKADYSDLPVQAIRWMQAYGRAYPHAGYGGSFKEWIRESDPQPYYSWGNGAAMRVSGCGFAAASLEEAKLFSRKVTEVTHNHPEGLKGAEAVAVAVYLAKTGASMAEIREYITANYYELDFTLDEIREEYHFHVSCQRSVPQALEAFFESTGFEDAIRNAISIGGDSDTIAAIAGSVADAYYGVPAELRRAVTPYLDNELLGALTRFELRYPSQR